MANYQQSPILAQLVVSRTADAIELSNRVVVDVRAASYRSPAGHNCGCDLRLRGRGENDRKGCANLESNPEPQN
jgi:hypothetical protein